MNKAKLDIHNLKGVAGNISATRLYNIAFEIESNLDKDQEITTEKMIELKEALSEAIKNCEKMVAT